MKCIKAPCYYLIASLFFAMALNASPITIGVSGGVSASVCFPVFCAASPQLSRYEQIYASTAFSNPVYIESITFYVQSSLNGDRVDSANLDISLSTTTSAINGLTSNLSANVTGTEVSFGNFTIPFTLSNPNSITFTGIPYLYVPSDGNLLLDVHIVSATANSHFTTLEVDTTGIVTQSAYAYVGDPGGPLAPSTHGLVTTFDGADVPEPAATTLLGLALIGIGLGLRSMRTWLAGRTGGVPEIIGALDCAQQAVEI